MSALNCNEAEQWNQWRKSARRYAAFKNSHQAWCDGYLPGVLRLDTCGDWIRWKSEFSEYMPISLAHRISQADTVLPEREALRMSIYRGAMQAFVLRDAYRYCWQLSPEVKYLMWVNIHLHVKMGVREVHAQRILHKRPMAFCQGLAKRTSTRVLLFDLSREGHRLIDALWDRYATGVFTQCRDMRREEQLRLAIQTVGWGYCDLVTPELHSLNGVRGSGFMLSQFGQIVSGSK